MACLLDIFGNGIAIRIMAKIWYTPAEVSLLLHIHPHTIRMAAVYGLIEGAEKEKGTNRWRISQEWVEKFTPAENCELLSDFLKRTGISRTNVIYAAQRGRIKLITIKLPWMKERKRVYIDVTNPENQIWMAERLKNRGQSSENNMKISARA